MGYGCLLAGIVTTAKPYLIYRIFVLEDEAPHIRELPYKGEFFFDVQNSPGYQIIYMMQTCITYIIIIFSVSQRLVVLNGSFVNDVQFLKRELNSSHFHKKEKNLYKIF